MSRTEKYIKYAEESYDELTTLVVWMLTLAMRNGDQRAIRVVTDLYEVAREFLFGDALHALLQLHRSDYSTAFPNGMINESAEYAELRNMERPISIDQGTWGRLYYYLEEFDESLPLEDIRGTVDDLLGTTSVSSHLSKMALQYLRPVRAEGDLFNGSMPNYCSSVKHFLYGYIYTAPTADSNTDSNTASNTAGSTARTTASNTASTASNASTKLGRS